MHVVSKMKRSVCFFRRIFSWEHAFLHQRLSSENKKQPNLDKYWRMLLTWFNVEHKNEFDFFLFSKLLSAVEWTSMINERVKISNT